FPAQSFDERGLARADGATDANGEDAPLRTVIMGMAAAHLVLAMEKNAFSRGSQTRAVLRTAAKQIRWLRKPVTIGKFVYKVGSAHGTESRRRDNCCRRFPEVCRKGSRPVRQ